MTNELDLFTPYIPDTRRESYHSLGALSPAQEQVRRAVESFRRPCSMKEIADRLNWPINRITPRVNEMIELKKLRVSHVARCPQTKRNVKYITT